MYPYVDKSAHFSLKISNHLRVEGQTSLLLVILTQSHTNWRKISHLLLPPSHTSFYTKCLLRLCSDGCVCVCAQSVSHVQLFSTPWTVSHEAPLSMEFSRQEYWSRLPFPPARDLPDPEIQTTSAMSPALAGMSFYLCVTWETHISVLNTCLINLL